MINENRLIENFLEMISFNSVSKQERDLADYLIMKFNDLGCSVKEDKAGEKIGGNCGNLYIRIEGDETLEPILLSAHLDTVEPGLNKKAIIGDDHIIRSHKDSVLGADDVAGIAAIFECIETMIENNSTHRSIEILLSVAEEAHLQGISNFEPDYLKSRQAYILDTSGPPGKAILKAPGHVKLVFQIRGRAAHAGIEPSKGVNAISIAAKGISEMKTGQVDDETTANVGSITGGGETNVVADFCEFTAECRSLSAAKLNDQVNHMKSCVIKAAELWGGQVQIDEHVSYLPYAIDRNSKVVQRFNEACKAVGIVPSYDKTGGGSDNNVLNQHAIEGIVISCGMNDVHSVNENISVEDLIMTARLTYALIFSSL